MSTAIEAVGHAPTPDLPFVNFQYMGGNMDGGKHREEYAVIRADEWRRFIAALAVRTDRTSTLWRVTDER